MQNLIDIGKALSDENRVRALMLLTKGELCLCQIIEMLGLAASTVSKHMVILKQAELVEARKQGHWVYYRLPGEAASIMVKDVILWVRKCLTEDKQILEDAARLETVMDKDLEELCRHYRR